MKVLNDREIVKCLRSNGFKEKRQKGSHVVWERESDKVCVTVNVRNVNRMVWQRLCKTYNIKCDF